MTMQREQSAGYMTNWAARLFAKAIDQRLKEIGVSSGQLPVFFALADGKALTQKQLTTIASIEQPTMAATLARMARDGLVQRRPDPADGRSLLVSLTPAARLKGELVQQAVAETNATALALLDDAQRVALLGSLEKVVISLQGLLADEG